jgi:putative phosphoesterase
VGPGYISGVRRATPILHVRESLALGPEGRLRLAVVADTHGHPDPRSLPLLASLQPDRILHAGDIGDDAVLQALATVAPVIAVRGNIDGQMPGVPDVVTLTLGDPERPRVKLLLLHIAVYGPRLRAEAARLARAEGAGVVVCGHSHVPFLGHDRGLAVVNAGSIGPRRFHLPIVFAAIDIRPETIDVYHLSCETGQRWLPG